MASFGRDVQLLSKTGKKETTTTTIYVEIQNFVSENIREVRQNFKRKKITSKSEAFCLRCLPCAA